MTTPNSPETRVLTAHVPVELAEEVDALAQHLERSRGWIVIEALMAFLVQERRRYELTLEGLSDVDAGRVIPQSAVEAWAVSLSNRKPRPLPKWK